MRSIAPNPFIKVVTILLVLNTLWSLFFMFLWAGGAFVFIIPSEGGESSAPNAMGPAILCGAMVLIACILPLVLALTAAGRFKWLAAGCCACWMSTLLWIVAIGAYPIVVLYFLPLTVTATAALGFFWVYDRSRGGQDDGRAPGTSPNPPGAPPRSDRERAK